jgi:phenylpropionate dioxygenase-like ring-hydroxylating dioxygenase large terminal subunit
MRPNYPFNCWYVAATSDEVGRDLLARRLLGTEVVLYRAGSGDVVAMEDRCVHRAYPLSAGRLDGDRLVCGLHGFVYDPDGTCVDVPSQENVPHGACVRTYRVHEQPPFVWIWLGEP